MQGTNSVDDNGQSCMSIERTQGVCSRRRVILQASTDVFRELRIDVLRRRMEIGSVESDRSPLLVFVGFVFRAKSGVVVSFVNRSRSTNVARRVTIYGVRDRDSQHDS